MKSNAEWMASGKFNPLLAVAACPGRKKDGSNPWTEEEFYASGAYDWRDSHDHWARYRLDRNHCLELG